MSKPKTRKRPNRGINVPDELYQRVTKHKEKTGIPITIFTRRALEAALMK